jgi:uncharacterized protein (TIGR02145 family)
MKNLFRISRVILPILSIFLIHSCDLFKPPIISTTVVTAISYTTATSGGEVTDDGGVTVTARGVCWNTSLDPTTSNNKTTDGTGTGSFTSSLTGLIAGTIYYIRAYATNAAGTGYGNQVTFTTSQIALAALTTTAITSITQTTAVSGGNIANDNGGSVTARGVCWSTSTNPTIALTTKTTDGTGIGTFTSSITGLTANATYYVKAYATNSAGTVYGNEVSFKTAATTPTLTTISASLITSTTASTGGNVTNDGGASVTAKGVCWSISLNPTVDLSTKTSDGTGTGSFVSNLISLQPGTIYYVRSYATNSLGTSYGNEINFTTLQPPTATTAAATSLASTTSSLNGTVNANNQSTTVTFEYGTTTSYGQTINAIPNTVSGSTNTGVSANLTGLTANTTYHFRVKAVSSVGTTYGSDVSFTTSCAGGSGIIFNPNLTYGSVTDIDGNTYKTIQIGTQTWMAENLKTIKYNDGTAISNVTNNTTWIGLTTGAYCWYNNDAGTYKATYGALYNWYTVSTGKLCPTGWHVPSDAEWTTLTTYLGGEGVPGGKLKETCTTHWLSPNYGATNESGFTALPGGECDYNGSFVQIGYYGSWWSSTEISTESAVSRGMNRNSNQVDRHVQGGIGKLYGRSVRCLRGEEQVLPAVTTNAASAITSTSATCGGNITSDGGAAVTARGVCWSTSANPTIALSTKTTDGIGTEAFTSSLIGLTANTTYYVRAYATNSAGTAYGNQVSFITSPTMPVLSTTTISSIVQTTATSGGNITSDGGATITARGVCWSTSTNPTIALSTKIENGTGTVTFTRSIIGLIPNTTYYVRSYATNSVGTGYGSVISFTTQNFGAVTDNDGNVYKTIIIGTQTWMAENLKTTKYNDGTAISNVSNNTTWVGLTTGAYCWYNNDAVTYKATYGALYNWYTVNTGKLCPTGWHVPTDAQWTTLTTLLGGEGVPGGKLKETGTTHWLSPNLGATNESAFTALPGGECNYNGSFVQIGYYGSWWSSTESSTASAVSRGMNRSFSQVDRSVQDKYWGYSVRCLRD